MKAGQCSQKAIALTGELESKDLAQWNKMLHYEDTFKAGFFRKKKASSSGKLWTESTERTIEV